MKTLKRRTEEFEICEFDYDLILAETVVAIPLAFNEEVVVAAMYDDDGESDGLVAFRVADITRVRWGRVRLKAVARDTPPGPLPFSLGQKSLVDVAAALSAKFGGISMSTAHDDGLTWAGHIRDRSSEFVELECWAPLKSDEQYQSVIACHIIHRVNAGDNYTEELRRHYSKDWSQIASRPQA